VDELRMRAEAEGAALPLQTRLKAGNPLASTRKTNPLYQSMALADDVDADADADGFGMGAGGGSAFVPADGAIGEDDVEDFAGFDSIDPGSVLPVSALLPHTP
jgi:hypothetical protein